MDTILTFLPAGQYKAKGPHELAGPCPRCGGRDRFVVWPERPRGGAYLCRQCGISGDAIQFLRDFRGMSFRDALALLGLGPAGKGSFEAGVQPVGQRPSFSAGQKTPVAVGRTAGGGHAGQTADNGRTCEFKAAEYPGPQWTERAATFLAACQSGLETCTKAVLALTGRYLTPDTAWRYGLGWNPQDRYESRSAWGLPIVQGRDKFLIPEGLLIATRRLSGVVTLTVRCPDDRPEGRPKYWQVAGSRNVPFVAGRKGLPVVLLESALDACLLAQEAGDLCASVALMGNMKGLDDDTAEFIRNAPAVAACPDNDAGGLAAWQRWKETFPSAVCCPAVGGKDIGEMHAAALSWPIREEIPTCRQWAEAALNLARDSQCDDNSENISGRAA